MLLDSGLVHLLAGTLKINIFSFLAVWLLVYTVFYFWKTLSSQKVFRKLCFNCSSLFGSSVLFVVLLFVRRLFVCPTLLPKGTEDTCSTEPN